MRRIKATISGCLLLLHARPGHALDSAADNILADASGDQTAQCLASVKTLGHERENIFEWTITDGSTATGSCHDVKASFQLCDRHPPRECLLARVPWQTAIGSARCCFHCCMHYWQDILGLSDIYKHWFENPKFLNLR